MRFEFFESPRWVTELDHKSCLRRRTIQHQDRYLLQYAHRNPFKTAEGYEEHFRRTHVIHLSCSTIHPHLSNGGLLFGRVLLATRINTENR